MRNRGARSGRVRALKRRRRRACSCALGVERLVHHEARLEFLLLVDNVHRDAFADPRRLLVGIGVWALTCARVPGLSALGEDDYALAARKAEANDRGVLLDVLGAIVARVESERVLLRHWSLRDAGEHLDLSRRQQLLSRRPCPGLGLLLVLSGPCFRRRLFLGGLCSRYGLLALVRGGSGSSGGGSSGSSGGGSSGSSGGGWCCRSSWRGWLDETKRAEQSAANIRWQWDGVGKGVESVAGHCWTIWSAREPRDRRAAACDRISSGGVPAMVV